MFRLYILIISSIGRGAYSSTVDNYLVLPNLDHASMCRGRIRPPDACVCAFWFVLGNLVVRKPCSGEMYTAAQFRCSVTRIWRCERQRETVLYGTGCQRKRLVACTQADQGTPEKKGVL